MHWSRTWDWRREMLKFEMLEWSECRLQVYSKHYPVTINKVCLISSKTRSMLGMQFCGKSLHIMLVCMCIKTTLQLHREFLQFLLGTVKHQLYYYKRVRKVSAIHICLSSFSLGSTMIPQPHLFHHNRTRLNSFN